ncbi:MAG: TonB-dependent receptor [Bacteroidia bacterium]|nr:TonB-dependent receptor [Bacteroidia bacterium]
MKLILLAVASLATLISYAQDTLTTQNLNDVVISATKFETNPKQIGQKIQVISAKELQWQNAANTADALSNTGNILVQKSQGGGGSPIIRGFEANKVLIEIDGVRLNNAIFRGGHLQNVLRIDNNALDKLEILYGPSSTIYGSDALGGVMHFITKAPKLNKVEGSAVTRYSTATRETMGNLNFNIGGKKWASFTSITFANYGDVVQGKVRKSAYADFGKLNNYVARVDNKDIVVANNNVNKQVGSGYEQHDIIEKLRYQQNATTNHTLNLQYSGTGDVNRYDRLTEINAGKPRYAEWYYGPEERLLTSYKLEKNVNKSFMDKLIVTAAYQNSKESRNSRRLNATKRKSQFENVNVYSIDIDALKKINRHEINYGAEAYFNTVKSSALFTTISTGVTSIADTRYPNGGNTMNNEAVYVQDKITLATNKLFLNLGARYNLSQLESKFGDTTYFAFPFDAVKQTNSALCGNVSLVYLPTQYSKISAVASTGYRTPNVDDISKVFESAAGKIIVPNANLKPEYTKNFELSASQTIAKKITLEAGAYYTQISNAITISAAKYNDKDSVHYAGVMSKVYSAENKKKAYIQGAYGALTLNVTKHISVNGTINYTYGRIKTDTVNIPLDHIAPTFGKAQMLYTHNKLQADVSFIFNGKKELKNYLLNGEDNEQYATKDGMPAWNTLNARVAYSFCKYLNVQLACDNILDANYRVFASGISAPGRNIRVTLRANF